MTAAGTLGKVSEHDHEHDHDPESEAAIDPEIAARRSAAMSFIRRLGDPALKSRASFNFTVLSLPS